MMKHLFVLLLLSLVVSACEEPLAPPETIQGLKPIYASQQVGDVISMPARPFDELGSILAIGSYVLLVEQDKGIHVIDNSDPNSPVTIAYLQLAGARQLTSDGDFVYASLGTDLYVLDIADWQTVTIVSILEDVIDADVGTLSPPLDYSGYFECVDLSMGNVVGWRSDVLNSPECRRF
jgi:hypothetical protein